jgi:hypothetical protein
VFPALKRGNGGVEHHNPFTRMTLYPLNPCIQAIPVPIELPLDCVHVPLWVSLGVEGLSLLLCS